MIIANVVDTPQIEFEKLLERTTKALEIDSSKRPSYYKSRGGVALEKDTFDFMSYEAKGTNFFNKIELRSGNAFPDIVTEKKWGLEVKSSLQNHWKTTGNSVLESTRKEEVERIYLLFGKLSSPIAFKYSKYEDCLYDVAVTHSPRYLVDMNTPKGSSIFDKMGISYNKLRNDSKPIQQIIKYYRSQLKPGEDLWWLESGELNQDNQTVAVRLWGNLSKQEKTELKDQAMALFPQIFGKDGRKYASLATWLAGSHGIVSPSLRDTFSAGGQADITIGTTTYANVPKIIKHLQDRAVYVAQYLKDCSDDLIRYYWNESVPKEKRLSRWVELVTPYASDTLQGIAIDIPKLITERLK